MSPADHSSPALSADRNDYGVKDAKPNSRRGMQVWRGSVPNQCATAGHHGVPLPRLSAHDGERVFPQRLVSKRSLRRDQRGPRCRWIAWRNAPLFLPSLHELDIHASRRLGSFVNVRSTMLDDAGSYTPFIETYTSEKLPWATTPAVHSFERFPPMEQFAMLLADYAERSK